MKDGIILDGVCCALCLHEEGCKISEHLTNSRHVAFCSNYEPDPKEDDADSLDNAILSLMW